MLRHDRWDFGPSTTSRNRHDIQPILNTCAAGASPQSSYHATSAGQQGAGSVVCGDRTSLIGFDWRWQGPPGGPASPLLSSRVLEHVLRALWRIGKGVVVGPHWICVLAIADEFWLFARLRMQIKTMLARVLPFLQSSGFTLRDAESFYRERCRASSGPSRSRRWRTSRGEPMEVWETSSA